MSSVKDRLFFDNGSLYGFVIGDNNTELDVIVTHLLLVLGFRNNLIGTLYLKDAIISMYNAPEGRKPYLSDIYKKVADSRFSTVYSVERDIRNCIRDSYNSGKLFVFNSFMRYETISASYPTTNSELLNNVVSWLRLQLKGRQIQTDE